ncbi:hybrid sensor histidine kinase/response regulator [Pararhizobium haloflavum]|uniref:hybrid sensor histidine kinase/response regulator n=1 Tax=Pararhizobium haloflavum TaxID=2037914 RepID=UPI000C1A7D94|nr:hybrid sensor histidine kinase/response regulator [Pararhizobium haloflavum]
MVAGWVIFCSALLYIMLLFAIASYGDRIGMRPKRRLAGRPVIYSLSLAIYCTSWTYFGSVGLAADKGWEFLGIYIGPILMFTLGFPIVRRIVRLAKAEKLTSIADFIAARYGKNPLVAGIVATIAVISAIPYIALQLKAVSSTVTAMVDANDLEQIQSSFFLTEISLTVAFLLAAFAVIFGTRHTDATEHQDGLILAIAMESVVKLVAFTMVGFFVVFWLYDGPAELFQLARSHELAMTAMAHETSLGRWVLLTVLSAFAILLLPRQFHVTVVENRTQGELKMAAFLFPAYLIAINLFALPVGLAGLMAFDGAGDADLYVLSLPLAYDVPELTLITFIGGFSAATAMVIVASVAIAIMISNDIVMPILLRQQFFRRAVARGDFTRTILRIRRTAIFVTVFLGYAYYRAADVSGGLSSIGLLSFAAIAQLAPALFGGLIWRGGNARGAVAGLVGGILVWVYLLLVPSLGGPDNSYIAANILAFMVPGTAAFSPPNSDPLFNATILSLSINILLYVLGSLSRELTPLERLQANTFIPQRSLANPASGRWSTKVTVKDLKQTIARYLGERRTERSFHTYETTTGRWLEPASAVDMGLVRFSEQLLGSAIGSASSRLVLSLLFQKHDDSSAATARLLDEASEALQYNRDLLQTALGQMDQGISVFDATNRLTVWNTRFRDLLGLPEAVGQVGFPLTEIIAILKERGDLDAAGGKRLLADFMVMDHAFELQLPSLERIIEIRSNPMPDKGVVTTYADITQRVAADKALKQINETLEQRVVERTSELTRVNQELADARAGAEEANIGKTRFLAAAGHDILQPLNAARLYSSSLVERIGDSENREIVANIDSSLESVETILGAVLDISRLDTGAMKPQVSSFLLNDLLRRVETDFAPIARAKNLSFKVMPTSVYVRSDPNLMRRLVQNLVSNAIKYTIDGGVLIGARRRGPYVEIQVVDTGIGIPTSKFRTVFREFARLDEGMKTASGLGLGLSIVDRIARVLDHPVSLRSMAGRGTDFRVRVPIETHLKRPVASPVRRAPPLPATPLTGLKVLIIDNEPTIIEGMKVLLGGWGCQVESLTALADIGVPTMAGQGTPTMPDVVVADYHLDDGDGIDAVRRLRALWNTDLPALLITADRSAEVRGAAEAERIAVQNKPVRPAALRAFLNQVVAARRTAAE